jgi:hypothetical protein
MTGFVIEKQGFTTASSLMADVAETMIANGFTQIFPSSPFTASGAGTTFAITLEASTLVDPLQSTQPWRIHIKAHAAEIVSFIVATPTVLPNDGSISFEKNSAGNDTDIIGSTGGIATGGLVSPTNLDAGFINRATRVGTGGNGYPMSYRLSISPRGIWLGTWEDAVTSEGSVNSSWVLVQRPVDRDTGDVVITGKAPVWCVNYTNGKYYQFVVRETDVFRPGARRPADTSTNDSEAIINRQPQVRLTEDGKYVVNFPSRMNSSRYRYSYELDMIGATSADVVSQYSDVSLQVYGELAARTYKALHANSVGNTGMRILVLTVGGGID